jgi:hypothetical protein
VNHERRQRLSHSANVTNRTLFLTCSITVDKTASVNLLDIWSRRLFHRNRPFTRPYIPEGGTQQFGVWPESVEAAVVYSSATLRRHVRQAHRVRQTIRISGSEARLSCVEGANSVLHQRGMSGQDAPVGGDCVDGIMNESKVIVGNFGANA